LLLLLLLLLVVVVVTAAVAAAAEYNKRNIKVDTSLLAMRLNCAVCVFVHITIFIFFFTTTNNKQSNNNFGVYAIIEGQTENDI